MYKVKFVSHVGDQHSIYIHVYIYTCNMCSATIVSCKHVNVLTRSVTTARLYNGKLNLKRSMCSYTSYIILHFVMVIIFSCLSLSFFPRNLIRNGMWPTSIWNLGITTSVFSVFLLNNWEWAQPINQRLLYLGSLMYLHEGE